MTVQHIPCGEFANESERTAVERLKVDLAKVPGRWIILSNVPHSVSTQAVPDDVDLIVIGPSGLHVIETKHWDASYVKGIRETVAHEANKLAMKVKRIASKIGKTGIDVGFLAGKFLLTRGSVTYSTNRPKVSGASFFGLKECNQLLEVGLLNSLSESEIERICQTLQPLSKIVLRGEVRSIATAKNLERVGSGSDRFHRIYRGEHIRTRDKIVLHLYDLSAVDDPRTEDLARRHAETLQKLQKSAFVPRIMDSYQEVPQYPGELWYFSIVDPCAPTLVDRCADDRWEIESRREFARRAVDALAEIHATQLRDVQFVHRHISPSSLLVGANNQPVFTDFDLARISGSMTLSPNAKLSEADAAFAAPEAVKHGLGSADQRSDVYSLCKSLSILFTDLNSEPAVKCLLQLEAGMTEDPAKRCSLTELSQSISSPDTLAASASNPQTVSMPARYWSEGDLVTFNTRQFRIASRIGSGSFGSTFKVIEVHEGQDVGIYAGKVMFEGDSGQRALNAYRRACSHTDKPHLATVFQLANEWDRHRPCRHRSHRIVRLTTKLEQRDPVSGASSEFDLTQSQKLIINHLRSQQVDGSPQ